MAIEKCINEYGVGHVIFEEGSTGRELYVVLDGQVEIAKVSGASKTVIVTLGKGEFFGEMAVIDGSSRSATAIAAAGSETASTMGGSLAGASRSVGEATLRVPVRLSTPVEKSPQTTLFRLWLDR